MSPALRRPDRRNPAARLSHSCAHVPHGKELHARRRRLRRAASRRACCVAASGSITSASMQSAASGPAATHRPAPPVPPAVRCVRRCRHGRRSPPSVRTVQRVAVISPRLNGAPPPPVRPRTITSPASGPRSTRYAGSVAEQRSQSSAHRAGQHRHPAAPGGVRLIRWHCIGHGKSLRLFGCLDS